MQVDEASQNQFDLLYTLIEGIFCELDHLKCEIGKDRNNKAVTKKILVTALQRIDDAQSKTQIFLDKM